jgi:SpoVK/Ycf46/Vps4 family AAA+-type ATPase
MIHAALPTPILQRLDGDDPYGLIVVAPSDKHVGILADAFAGIVRGSVVHCLDKPTARGASELVEDLSRGETVVAICGDLDDIPASFKALADHTVQLLPHDARVLRKTMAATLVGPIPRFGKRFAVHPDPELLCRCIAPGLPPQKVADALAKLGEMARPAAVDRLPDLDHALEFGDARSWGLQLRSDLAAWKAGKLDAADLDAGLLLVSPPGCGKTTFARVLAKGLGVPLIELKLGDLFVNDGHLGDVIGELRRRFSKAMGAAPAVLLLDELDSLGRRDERERHSTFKVGLINEILTLLDGAGQKRPGFIVIGATNAPASIDPALRRPGRLGRTIELGPPGPQGIENVLRFHLRGDLRTKPLDEVVRLNAGSTPAELMDLVRMARQVARSQDRALQMDDLLLQTLGTEPIDWQMVNRVAIHEAGHALACLLLDDAPILHSVSILESSDRMGHALTLAPPGATTKARLEAKVMVTLAGRAAEALVYGQDDPSDGAAGDLENATSLLCHMHGSWGMGGSLLHVSDPRELLMHDGCFAERIEAELDRLMVAVSDELRGRELYLHGIAFELCSRRTLSGDDVARIVEGINEVGKAVLAEGDLVARA